MGIAWPTEEEPYGIFYPSLSKQPSLDGYYRSVEALTPHLRAARWTDTCSGFYVSSVDMGLTRVTYFAADASAATSAVEAIYADTDLLEARPPTALAPVRFVDTYRGSESRFRRYLCTYAQIGLDLLESDRLEAQRLFATYRWRVWTSDESGRHHLEPDFLRRSPAYQSLSAKARSEFWEDFDYAWGWSHMFVNMILVVDWPVPRAVGPISFDDLAAILSGAGLDFDVPSGWKPGQ